MAKQLKSRYWSIIAYPDSVPKDWIDILTSTGLQMSISPLHDHDLDPEGENGALKKPHWHILACFDGPTTKNALEEIALRLGTHIVTPVNSCRGMYRYHIHQDNPEKYQYDDKDRTFINGFLIENYSNLTSSEEIEMKRQIQKYIISENICEYSDLLIFLETEDLQAYGFATNHTFLFNTFIRSRVNKLVKNMQHLNHAIDDAQQELNELENKIAQHRNNLLE